MWHKKIKKHYNAFTHPIVVLYISLFIFCSFIALSYESSGSSFIFNFKKSKVNKLHNIELTAKAVYVFDDKEQKVLFEKNAHTAFPIASITKLMTARCALDTLGENNLVLVPDSVFALNDNTDPKDAYESWSVQNLVTYTLIESSNEGAEALGYALGGEEKTLLCMNKKASDLGLVDTSFYNVSGLDQDISHAGAYASAQNVYMLMKSVFDAYPHILSKTSYINYLVYSRNGIIHNAHNTNLVSDKIVGIVASKTGNTLLAGGNLVYIMNAGIQHNIYVVILGSTKEARFEDALILNDAIIKSFGK